MDETTLPLIIFGNIEVEAGNPLSPAEANDIGSSAPGQTSFTHQSGWHIFGWLSAEPFCHLAERLDAAEIPRSNPKTLARIPGCDSAWERDLLLLAGASPAANVSTSRVSRGSRDDAGFRDLCSRIRPGSRCLESVICGFRSWRVEIRVPGALWDGSGSWRFPCTYVSQVNVRSEQRQCTAASRSC